MLRVNQSVQPLSQSPGMGCGSSLTVAIRTRFYRPLMNQGINLWRGRMGRIYKQPELWNYQRKKMDPMPFPEKPENNYYGKRRISWNPIPSKVGVVNRKAEDFDWPHRDPPPTGLIQSQEFFPHFFERYFPDVECRLVVDSLLNNETTEPVFLFPPDLSKAEIVHYLRNVHGFDNIVSVSTKNLSGRKYKNEIGSIRLLPAYKQAVVVLDAPVKIDFKAIKGTEDTADSKPSLTGSS